MNVWGYSTHIDLYDCDEKKIRSRTEIIRYVDQLCNLIKMKKYEGCLINHFGEDEKVKGYTFVQMIETSLISGHLVEVNNSAFIDIFSCKPYDEHEAHEFTQYHFGAKVSKF